jgi:hypothetical protein
MHFYPMPILDVLPGPFEILVHMDIRVAWWNLENKERPMQTGQSRDTGNLWHTRRGKNTTQYVPDCTTRKKEQTTQARHDPTYKKWIYPCLLQHLGLQRYTCSSSLPWHIECFNCNL